MHKYNIIVNILFSMTVYSAPEIIEAASWKLNPCVK